MPLTHTDWVRIAGSFAAVATVLYVLRSQKMMAPNRRKARLRGWKETA